MTNLIIRFAQPSDSHTLFALIQGLAKYEKLSDAVIGNAEGQAVGFAIFFHNYSTFLTKPGLYLEDIFVLPEYRRQGIGKALLAKVAQIALERDCGRLEWSVLDWNVSAQAFYRNMGADILDDWRICRVTEKDIPQLANQK